jgi:hypothetical protein
LEIYEVGKRVRGLRRVFARVWAGQEKLMRKKLEGIDGKGRVC